MTIDHGYTGRLEATWNVGYRIGIKSRGSLRLKEKRHRRTLSVVSRCPCKFRVEINPLDHKESEKYVEEWGEGGFTRVYVHLP